MSSTSLQPAKQSPLPPTEAQLASADLAEAMERQRFVELRRESERVFLRDRDKLRLMHPFPGEPK